MIFAELIKRGETSGSIEIHLFNYPSDGYEYETFGSRIIVHREVNASGSSAYKIKSAQGKVVSKSRDKLMQLLMYLNIQVDNPVCVLNQDASRSFLREWALSTIILFRAYSYSECVFF